MRRPSAKTRFLASLIAIAAISGTTFGPNSQPVGAAFTGQSASETPLWLELARSFASVLPPPMRDLIGAQAVSTGRDGRLTVLLLGSDTRASGIGRTDTIMVFSLRGNSISAVSIPRDTSRIPNPDGGTFSGRVNGIVRQLKQGRSNQQALAEFKRVIENLLQIEIDHYALVTFAGFHALVDDIDPVRMNTRQVRDTQYQDDPNLPKGVYFPGGNDYELFAWQPGAPSQLCNGLYQTQGTGPANWCRRAMPYVRSRKGSSDFARAARQQDFVMATIRRVLARGNGSLGSLVNVAQGASGYSALITDIPLNVGTASDIFSKLNGASLSFSAVLSPPRYSNHIPGGTAYELDMDAVRATMRQHFGSTGTPPPPTPTPSPTLGTTPAPTRTPTLPPGATPTPTLPPGATPTPTLPPGATPTPTLPPGATPTPTLPPGVTPAPTLAPGQTPTLAPTLAPGQTATPAPTLAPGQTPTPAPTLAPGQTATPAPTLAPGQTASPTDVAIVPSAGPGDPGATPAPGAAVVPTPIPGAPTPAGAPASDNNVLIVVALLAALVAGAAAFVGYRRLKASP